MNSLPKTVTRQRRGCDLIPGRTAPESSTLTTRLPSHPISHNCLVNNNTNSIDNGRVMSDVELVVGDETCAGLGRHSELVVGRCFQQVVSADRSLGDRFLHGANPLRSTRPLHLHTEAQSSTRIEQFVPLDLSACTLKHSRVHA